MYRINYPPKKLYHELDILKDKFQNIIKLRKCSALEIGCGIGIESRFFYNFFKTYIAIDTDKQAISIANENKHSLYKNLYFMTDDIKTTNITDKKDIIISINTIHYIYKKTDLDLVFKNIFSLLTKNGICIIIEPKITSVGWGDSRLNESSPQFNKELWNDKKKSLNNEHIYIINNITNFNYSEYEDYRIYVISK
jgi:SAM-dependent methyltransferase